MIKKVALYHLSSHQFLSYHLFNETYDIWTYSFVLMWNHFHLLLETPLGSLVSQGRKRLRQHKDYDEKLQALVQKIEMLLLSDCQE